MKRTLGLALVALIAAAAALDAYAAPTHQVATKACSPNGKAVTIGGKAATVYCGAAKATVVIGFQKMTFRNGTCVWGKLFKLRMGTIFLFRGKPLQQQQPGFSIYADSKAHVEFYWGGRYYYASPLYTTAQANSTRTGGTFKGRIGKGGTGLAITGTIRCS